MLEYLTSFYTIALIATILGLLIIYIYDRFEKKQYSGANYFRFAILIYIATFGALYVTSILSVKLAGGDDGIKIMDGGSTNSQVISTAGDYAASKMHLEQFKTGIPTF